MNEYFLFTFDSTHFAIKAQRLLKDLKVITMPTLREISASCGMSLRVQPQQVEEAVRRMETEGQGWHLYRIVQEGKGNNCTFVQEKD